MPRTTFHTSVLSRPSKQCATVSAHLFPMSTQPQMCPLGSLCREHCHGHRPGRLVLPPRILFTIRAAGRRPHLSLVHFREIFLDDVQLCPRFPSRPCRGNMFCGFQSGSTCSQRLRPTAEDTSSTASAERGDPKPICVHATLLRFELHASAQTRYSIPALCTVTKPSSDRDTQFHSSELSEQCLLPSHHSDR